MSKATSRDEIELFRSLRIKASMSEIFDLQSEKIFRQAINDSLPVLENADWRGPEATITGLRAVFRDPKVQGAAKQDSVTRTGKKVQAVIGILEKNDAKNCLDALAIIRRLLVKPILREPLITGGRK